MRTELLIIDGFASIQLLAETSFEKEIMGRCHRSFPNHKLSFNVEQSRNGYIDDIPITASILIQLFPATESVHVDTEPIPGINRGSG